MKTQHSSDFQSEPYREKEINLLDLVITVLKHKKFIFITCLLGVGFVLIHNWYSSKKLYHSECIIAPHDADLDSIQNSLNKILRTPAIIDNDRLKQILFPSTWDEKEKKWSDGKAPSDKDVHMKIQEILTVMKNRETETLLLSVKSENSELPVQFLCFLVKSLDDFFKHDSARKREKNRGKMRYLKKQLEITADPVLKQQIAANFSYYLDKENDARIGGFTAFHTISLPSAPEMKEMTKPISYKLIISVLILSLVLGIVLSFVLEYASEVKKKDSEKLEIIKRLLFRM